MEIEQATEMLKTYFRIKKKEIIEPLVITEKEQMRKIGAEQIVNFLLKEDAPKTSDDTFRIFGRMESLYRRYFEETEHLKESTKN